MADVGGAPPSRLGPGVLAGAVWGARDELSSLQGAGTPGTGIVAPGAQSPGCSPWAHPSVIPTRAGSKEHPWGWGGSRFIFSFSNKLFCRAALRTCPAVGKANRPQAQRVREGSLRGTERVVTHLEAPRLGCGSQDTAPCPVAPAPAAPWRLQLPGALAHLARLYVNEGADPPIAWRVDAVTWCGASFLCAPLFPSSAAILFSPRVGSGGSAALR